MTIFSYKMSIFLPKTSIFPSRMLIFLSKMLILEDADPLGPWGARGMAEMPYLPFAPVVCAAVKDAIGVWIDSFPLTPERVLKALKAQK